MAAFSPKDLQAASAAVSAPPEPAAAPDVTRIVALAETMMGLAAAPATSSVVLAGVVRMLEAVLLVITGFLVHALYVAPAFGYSAPYFIAIPLMSVLTVVMFQALQINHVNAFRQPLAHIFRIAGGWSLIILTALAIVFFARQEIMFSRVWLASWFFLGLGALFVERGLVGLFVQRMTRAGRLDRRTAIVGGGEAGESLLRELSAQEDSDLRICGVFDDRTDARSPDVVAGYPKLGNVDDLVEFARHTRLDLVIFTMPITAEQRLLTMLRKLWVLPIDIRLSAHMNKLRFRPRSYSYIGAVPVLDVFDKPIADWDVVLKSVFDRVIGACALVALSPVLLLTALAVRLVSKGPVIFRQKRYGFNNEMIEVYKFRSMYADRCDANAEILVTKTDDRVTPVGRFIRSTSLDELPQLFNVALGNTSLVGPRPHAIQAKAGSKLYDEVVDGYYARHRVKPGITGWAQINGWRGETDTADKIQQRVLHDLYYIENWSVFLDAYILAKTPFALFSRNENAY